MEKAKRTPFFELKIDTNAEPLPSMMTRAQRGELVDRVVRECQRDRMFAHLLSDNLQASGVLPPPDVPAAIEGRPQLWSEIDRLWLVSTNAAIEASGVNAAIRYEQLAEALQARTGLVLSSTTLANYVSAFRKDLIADRDINNKVGVTLCAALRSHKK